METRTVEWLWEIVRPMMDPYQFVDLKKCSAVHALVEICDQCFSKTDDSCHKDFLYPVLVDYSKAFDRINCIIFISKLIA